MAIRGLLANRKPVWGAPTGTTTDPRYGWVWRGLLSAGWTTKNGAYDAVARQHFRAESGVVGVGTTDGDSTQHAIASAAGQRIILNTIPFQANFTILLRLRHIARGATAVYESFFSRGGVFENNTQFAVGIRDTTRTYFLYGRNVGVLVGGETSGVGTEPAASDIIHILARWKSGTQDTALFFPNGALNLSFGTTTGNGTDGSQPLILAGPNTFTSTDRSASTVVLGWYYWNFFWPQRDHPLIHGDFYAPLRPTRIWTTPGVASAAVISPFYYLRRRRMMA